MVDYTKNILKNKPYSLTDRISIHQPSLDEVIDYGEESYLNLIYRILTARPYDYMVELDDIGQDYQEISDYMFFLSLYKKILPEENSMFFTGFNFSNAEIASYKDSDVYVLYDKDNDSIFDELSYRHMVDFVRKLHCIDSKIEFDAGNNLMKKQLISRERKRRKRLSKKNLPFKSVYSNVISSLVNVDGFKYDYESIYKLSIGQFYDAWYRVGKIKQCDHTMMGLYFGTVDGKKLDKEELNWMGSLK